MTREQFNKLLHNPGTIDLNLVTGLEDIVTRFPYFQNAHLLLAKQYHGHENIRFESYLRKASVYAPDRSVLFHLIRQETDQIIHISEHTEPNTAPSEMEPTVQAISNEDVTLEKPGAEAEEAVISTEAQSGDTDSEETRPPISGKEKEEPVKEVPGEIDPRKIIEQRLKEISGKSTPDPLPEVKTGTGDKSENIEPPAEKESAEATFSRTPLPKQEKVVPEQIKPESKQASPAMKPSRVEPEKHTFTEWLRLRELPVIDPEQSSVEPEISKLPDNKKEPLGHRNNAENLIDSFIRTDPRIVPARSEFYSPGNMARKSAMEHEDLISETLARIYAQQGNIPKAIETYRRLSLKLPEKSSYFADLIQKLEEETE